MQISVTNEQYLAGSILISPEVIPLIVDHVSAEDFQSEHCCAIFESAKAIAAESGIVDPVTIIAKAKRNGVDLSIDYLAQLMDVVPTAANCVDYAERVAEDARRRKIVELAEAIQEDSASTSDELIAKVQQETARLSKGQFRKSKGLSVTSAEELQQAELLPTVFLITGLLPEGTSIISAASKIGKSWMVLDMGLCIAAGKPFMGHSTAQCGVLYLALEDSLSRLQDRMNKVLAGSKAPTGFYFATEAPNLDNGLLDALEGHLQQHPETKLIIIDTLQKIRGRALSRESAYEQDYREMGTVKAYMDKKGVSVLFVHHNRKMKDGDDPFNMISGTNGIMGASDTSWTILKTKRSDNEATLHITGRDVEQTDTVITFDKSSWKWKPVGAADLINAQRDRLAYEKNPIVKTIKELLKQNQEWAGTSSELLNEGKRICKCPIAVTPQELGYALRGLDGQLLDYDGIVHKKPSNGTGGRKHYFFYQSWIDKAEEQDELPL